MWLVAFDLVLAAVLYLAGWHILALISFLGAFLHFFKFEE